MAMYLIVDEERLEEAVVDLVHVGLDQVAGWATPDMFREYAQSGGRVDRVGEIDAAQLDDHLQRGAWLLDVRRASELAETGRIGDAKNIAHTRLLDRIGEVPKDEEILIYCGTGIRSAYACGLLDRFGYRTTNVAGGIDAWRNLGGEINAA
jgi:hydroxyacylglutathione hydrolase